MTDDPRNTTTTAIGLASGSASRGREALIVASVLLLTVALPSVAHANQPPVAGPDQVLNMDEDTTLAILLEGTDPDGDPISATITDLTFAFPPPNEPELVDSLGNPVGISSVAVDRQLFMTPPLNIATLPMAVITYQVHDGTQTSANTATVTVNVNPVNDPPTVTLPTTLVADEDTTLDFVMGGIDLENDVFLCRFTALADPDFGVVLYLGPGGPFDMSSLSGRDQMMNNPSDIALGWPMSLTTTPDQCQDVEFNSFTYWFEHQIFPAIHSPESHVVLQVRCINDAPRFAVTGQGTQTFATFTTTLSGSGAFTLPVLGLLDVDGVGNVTGPDPGLDRITITTRSGGTIAVDEGSFPGTTFTSSASSIVFDAVTATVDSVLDTLVYTAPASPAADTLTIVANDGGSNQGCVDPADGSTCPLVAGLNVDITVDAGGTLPGAMSLTPGTGGFLTVNTTSDDVDTNGNCTLREAVTASNDDVAVDGCPAGLGDDIIILPTGTYPLSLGTIVVDEPLMIVGAGDTFSFIDGGGVQVFDAVSPLTLRDVAVVGEDPDGDGIRSPVDGEILGGSFADQGAEVSDRFTDEHLGGTTFGTIVTRADLVVTVSEVANPGGVAISASGGGAGTAEIDPCGTLLALRLTDGESALVTCSSLGVTTRVSFTSFTPSSSVTTEPVTVGVSVATEGVGGAGTVTGSVTISDGAGASCVGVLVDGSTSCVLTPTIGGTRTWTATYAADGVFLGSDQPAVVAVQRATTTTAITVHTPNPSRIGEAIAVGWSVQAEPSALGPVAGVVTVTDGVSACSAPVSAGGCSLALTTGGPRTLRASFGDVNFGSSQGWAPHLVLVDTVTTITSHTPDPSAAFEPIEVEIAVSAPAPGAGTPTGEVRVDDGDGASCTATLAAGSATCMLTPTVVGSRDLEATYLGNPDFGSSQDSAPHEVVGADTVTTITSHTPDPSAAFQPIEVEIAVSAPAPGAGTPTGEVSVDDGAGASCTATLAAGSATCMLTPTVPGSRDLQATYLGNGAFASSQGSAPHVVVSADTVTTILSHTPDPSAVFEPIEVEIAVSAPAPGAGTPTGEVSVDDGAGASCTATLAAGSATCMLTPTVVGSRDLEATYLGDGNYTSSATTEPHLVTDGVAPQVLTVATLSGSAVDECATVRAAMTGFAVTFDEPVQGADEVGSYLILAAGPDADFSTAACGVASGDDIEILVSSVSSDLDPTTPTLAVQLDERVPSGLLRLIVCETVEDLSGFALDGDGDGVGGDAWVHTFRVDPGNLLINGDFDRCPVTLAPWIEVASPPDAVLPSESEDADASELSGSARIFSAGADGSALAQCVDLQPGLSNRELAFAFEARLDAFGAATATLTAGCDLFDLPACAGPLSAAGEVSAPLPDQAGAWTHFDVSFESPATNASALCSVAVTPGDPGEPSFDAYLDRLSLREVPSFADGFESGDTNAWSLTVGD